MFQETPALPAGREVVNIKVGYYPDTDSLSIKSKTGVEAEGSEVAPGIVFHYTSEGEVTAIDIDSEASKLVDLLLLEELSPTGYGRRMVELQYELRTPEIVR